MRAGTRKYVLLVPDGAADLYREEGQSPLGLARTPYTDFLAREGVAGRMRTFYPDLPRESMVAQLGMLGWDPRIYYPHGRSSCELLALQDVYLGEDDLAFRANLVRLEGRTLASYSASCIASADARPLVERIDRTLRSEFPEIELYPNSDFRNTLVLRGARIDPRRLVCPEPHEHQGEEFDLASLIAGTDPESRALAARINAWLTRAAALLEGEPANALFPWSASRAFRLPPFAEISGFSGRVAIVGFMDFLLGIARAGAIDFFRLGNGRPDTDFQAKGAKVVELLAAGYELVVCHVNAPDEASHLGDLRLKIQCLEAFDHDVVGPVVEYFRRHPEELGGVMVAPDHYTNHALEGKQRALAHSLDPAPFCLWNGVDRDAAASFSEDEALNGRWGREPVSHLDLLGLLGLGREPERHPAPAAPVAIVGIGCRFPGGVDGPEMFWRRLCEGFDAITEVPPHRFDLEAVYDSQPGARGKMLSRYGGFLGPVEAFDAAFFGISPREAPRVDPQQRLLLEVGWEALEDAGLPLERLPRRAGVFLGMMSNDFEDMIQRDPESLDTYGLNGAGRYGASGRLSFFFGFEGPSLCVDTACSSSLVSVHLACQSLRQGECDLALAGGSHLLLQPHVSIALGNILSPDGRCKFGDARANGFVRSEGVGLIVLKRLDDALRDGDRIHAVIRGSAVNSDGASNGMMATPSIVTQQAMLREAYRAAGVSPGRIGYVEAHGTGTPVGDRVELAALGGVLGEGREPGRRCRVGSVKTNFGHSEGASGIAGLIKLALCLRHRQIPPSLHFVTPNPEIPWAELPLVIQSELAPWPGDATEAALGGVNSFGLSGTNAHVVLEEPPRPAALPAIPEAGPCLLPLSARRPESLRALARAWRDRLATASGDELRDLAWSAAVRRTALEHRLAVAAATPGELREKLEAWESGEERAGVSAAVSVTVSEGGREPGHAPRVAFVFPGQGSQWLGMGRELAAQEPVFREALERCDRAVAAETGWSLLAELSAPEGASRLGEIDVVQPCLFALQVALAALWRSWGVEPAAVVGHSMGEVAAAHVAGALSLADAARIICRRSRLLRRVSGQGAMLVVELPLERATALIAGREDRVSVAVSNSSESTVLSGEPGVLDEIAARLEADGLFCRRVRVDVASHSPQMDPLRDDLLAALDGLAPRAGTVPVGSTVDAAIVDGAGFDAAYWVRNLRQPVLFAAAVRRLAEQGCDAFLEVSPHPLLLPAVEQTLRGDGRPGAAVPSLRREEPERLSLLGSLGRLWTLGQPVAWEHLFAEPGRLVSLPSYPWQREPHWMRGWLDGFQDDPRPVRGAHPLLGPRVSPALSGLHVWETEIASGSPSWLGDHRVRGSVILPAAAYLEAGLAAAEEALGRPCRLAEVAFDSALLLPEGERRSFQVLLAQSEGGATLSFFSRGGLEEGEQPWTRHASARVLPAGEREAAPVDLAGVRQGCGEEVSGEAFYERLGGRGLEYGPSFRGVERLWRRDGEALGRLLPPPAERGCRVHPALLDAAFQLLLAARPVTAGEEADAFLPVAVDEVSGWRPALPGGPFWGHARIVAAEGDLRGDVTLVGEGGEVLLEARGLHLRRLPRDVRREIPSWLYEVRWMAEPARAVPALSGSGGWLLLADAGGVAAELATRLESLGHRVRLVRPGELDSADSEGLRRRLSDIAGAGVPLLGAVHLWSLDPAAGDGEAPERARRLAVSALSLAQAMVTHGGHPAPRLWLVTRRAWTAGAETAPEEAGLWGMGRVIAREHPELRCARVELAVDEPCQTLLAEVLATGSEDEVALSGGERRIPRLARCAPPEEVPERFRRDGSYLITGGLGGLGLTVARWMAERGAGTLVLAGRRAPSPAAAAVIAEIERRGVHVRAVRLDVARRAEVTALVEEISAGPSPLRGVLHAAGVLEDGVLLEQSAERLDRVFAPKVDGAWWLHDATRELPLDVFVLFSSVASVLGTGGQAGYAAANAFLDALARRRRAVGLPALSVQWGAWGEVGLAARDGRTERLERQGISGLPPEAACDALGRLLGHPGAEVPGAEVPRAEVMVAAIDWTLWRESCPSGHPAPLLADLVAERPVEERDGGWEAWQAAVPEERRRLLEECLRREAAAVLRLSSARLDESRTLTQLGLDSLMALELKGRIGTRLGAHVPVTRLLQGLSFRQLVEQVADQVSPRLSPPPPPVHAGVWEEIEL